MYLFKDVYNVALGIIYKYGFDRITGKHKSNVKNPYRMSNKRDYILQMLNTVWYIILFIWWSLAIYFYYYSINVNRYDAN